MKNILEASLPTFSVVANRRSYNVYDTKHSIERAAERTADREELKFIVDKGIEWLAKQDKLKKFDKDKATQFLFFSKSMNRGIVVDYRKDPKNRGALNKHIYIITVLPTGSQFAKSGTHKVVTESESFECIVVELDEETLGRNFDENDVEIFLIDSTTQTKSIIKQIASAHNPVIIIQSNSDSNVIRQGIMDGLAEIKSNKTPLFLEAESLMSVYDTMNKLNKTIKTIYTSDKDVN